MYCLAPAMPSQAVAIEAARKPQDAQHDGRWPESPASVVWIASISDLTLQRELIAPTRADARTDATLTYLKTGRLRL